MVLLFVPNLMGYMRILLLLVAVVWMDPWQADWVMWLIVVSIVLDLFDGIAARRLRQCSKFGEFLDVVADNLTRGSMVMLAARSEHMIPSNVGCIFAKDWFIKFAGAGMMLEWLCFVCTHPLSLGAMKDATWKRVDRMANPPAFISMFMSNNFKNPLGTVGIFSLSALPIVYYGTVMGYSGMLPKDSFWFHLLMQHTVQQWIVPVLMVGRLATAVVEIWFVKNHVLELVDMHEKEK